MSTMLPVNPLISFARAPRAQFFANRAVSHLCSLTSFDEIIDQQSVESIVSRHQPAQPQSPAGKVYQPGRKT